MPKTSKNKDNSIDKELLFHSDLTLLLNIRSRTKEYFHGEVHTITAVNASGVFDILPLHANFITLIKDYVILEKNTSKEQKIEFKSAVVSVTGNRVEVYVDI